MEQNLNKYLVFKINDEEYAVSITKVKEVMRYIPITPVHEASRFLKGVINMRGKIVPIIDMRSKLNIEEKPYDERTIFIVLEVQNERGLFHIGIAVDVVSDVIDMTEDQIETTPSLGLKLKSQYLKGVANVEDRLLMILNIDKVLTTDEVVGLERLDQNGVPISEQTAVEA